MLFLDHLSENHRVIINALKTVFIHPDIYDFVDEFKQNATYKQVKLEYIGFDKRNKSNKL